MFTGSKRNNISSVILIHIENLSDANVLPNKSFIKSPIKDLLNSTNTMCLFKEDISLRTFLLEVNYGS